MRLCTIFAAPILGPCRNDVQMGEVWHAAELVLVAQSHQRLRKRLRVTTSVFFAHSSCLSNSHTHTHFSFGFVEVRTRTALRPLPFLFFSFFLYLFKREEMRESQMRHEGNEIDKDHFALTRWCANATSSQTLTFHMRKHASSGDCVFTLIPCNF